MGLLRKIMLIVVLYIVFCFVGLKLSEYIGVKFSDKELSRIAKSQSGERRQKSFSRNVREEFSKNEAHAGMILSADEFQPFFLRTGGFQGSVDLLYSSLFEFVILYHAPMLTSGTTGRHFVSVTVSVLQGSVKVWAERKQKVERYSTGEKYTHKSGAKTYVEISEGTHLLIHGKGLVPTMMGYVIGDDLFNSGDPLSAGLTASYFLCAITDPLCSNAWLLASNGVSHVLGLFES